MLDDQLGLALLAPEQDWRRRGDMDPEFTRPFRASIVAPACFIEDLVTEQVGCGLSQYVILGAGLDSFTQRKPDIASRLKVFEIDRPGPQAWKRQRLIELGFGVPDWLRFEPRETRLKEPGTERRQSALRSLSLPSRRFRRAVGECRLR